MKGYCTKCQRKVKIRKKREMVAKNGVTYVKGVCERCGQTVTRFQNRPKEKLVCDYAAEHPKASPKEIAAALGVSLPTVQKWLPDRKAGKRSSKEERAVAEKIERDNEQLILELAEARAATQVALKEALAAHAQAAMLADVVKEQSWEFRRCVYVSCLDLAAACADGWSDGDRQETER